MTPSSPPEPGGPPAHPPDPSRLCIHSITTKPWPAAEAARRYAAAGVKGITLWRDALLAEGPAATGRLVRDHGLEVVSLCRGGFFASASAERRAQAIDDNRRCIDAAAALGAPLVVLVCGAEPGQALAESRRQICDGIAAVLPHAAAARVRLAVEPLHPMYAGDRSAVNTVAQAREMCRRLASPWAGVAVDVYHTWWDENLQPEIAACGREGRLFAFHVCDWLLPTVDLLEDRGLMGEGCIPIREIRGWVEAAGFAGFIEVEIFSRRLWAQDQAQFLERITQAYRSQV
ncbi:MAG TPA: sugar phosphate isomerase/epimerase family protein [Opitutaceae bacterium]|jgi:sugar phosphate isomerase/epimerase|nr:sugar phosphate isomerase/epimerase family protein [Opitutaceae bacterium]